MLIKSQVMASDITVKMRKNAQNQAIFRKKGLDDQMVLDKNSIVKSF